jgi:selenide,water dikinase
MAVVGTVHPDRIGRKGGARPGDVLLLTKPLGTGIITTAAKGDAADPAHVDAATETMLALNRRAAELAHQVDVHSMTDITGFALLGHGYEMAAASEARLRFYFDRIPFLDGAREYAEMSLFPGGACNNQRTFEPHVTFHGLDEVLDEEMQMLLWTPETSGGLLIAISPADGDRLEAIYREAGQAAWRIGDVVEGEGIEVIS